MTWLGRPPVLVPVAPGRVKPPVPPHCVCPACGARHKVTTEVRRLYCGCQRAVLLVDWARAG